MRRKHEQFRGYGNALCSTQEIMVATTATNNLDEKYGLGAQILNGMRSDIRWECAASQLDGVAENPSVDSASAAQLLAYYQPQTSSQAMPYRTVEYAAAAINKMQKDLQMITRVMQEDPQNIADFKDNPKIVAMERELNSLKESNASSGVISATTYALKDAKVAEQAQRLQCADTMHTLETVLGSAAIIAANADPHIAKIISAATSLLSLGKNVGALAGWGALAGSINPAIAAVNVGLALSSLCSLFSSNKDNSTALLLENLHELKRMVETLRKEMHERFDILEDKLEQVHLDITNKIAQISLQNEQTQLLIAESRHENQKAHGLSHQHLKTIQGKIDECYAVIRHQDVDAALHAVTDPVQCSLNDINVLPTPQRYAELLSQFQLNIEQTVFSAALAGERYCSPENASRWSLDGKQVTEGLFHLNSLLGYLEQYHPEFKNIPLQPNTLLWTYPALAILRLLFITNNSDTGLIRRNEFNILELIRTKAEEIKAFKVKFKDPVLMRTLAKEYHNALIAVDNEINLFLVKTNSEKNEQLNNQANLRSKTLWTEQSHLLSTLAVTTRTDYSGWFYGWTSTHYGGTEYGQRCVTIPKANYLTTRANDLNGMKHSAPAYAYTAQAGIQLETSGLTVNVTSQRAVPVCLISETNGDPILNLFGANNAHINLRDLLNIPETCQQAEYLGLGTLHYRYKVETANKKMHITGYFEQNDNLLPISALELYFDIGPYERCEGILWGWIGNTNCNVVRTNDVPWTGSTGKAKHWFVDHGTVPALSYIDAGPFASLSNPKTTNARPVTVSVNPQYAENQKLINQSLIAKLNEILQQYGIALREQALTETSSLGVALMNLEAAYQRVQAYLMVSLPDDYAGAEADLSFSTTNLNKNVILQQLLTQPATVHLLSTKLKTQMSTLPTLFDRAEKLLQSRQTVTNDHFFDVVYEFIRETYDFYKDRVLETGTYKDIFAKQSETEQKYESVSELLSIVVSAVAAEVKDSSTREKIVQRVQQQMANLRMITEAEPITFSAARAISRLGICASPESAGSVSIIPDSAEQNKPQ